MRKILVTLGLSILLVAGFASTAVTQSGVAGANTTTGVVYITKILSGALQFASAVVLQWPDLTVSDSSGAFQIKQYEAVPSAPSAALAGAGAGNVDNGSHVYQESCVTAGGQTLPSASSGTVTVADKTVNGKVTVTLTACDSIATGRNLYRSKAGTTTPLFLVVASPVVADAKTTATYTDNIADASLQAGGPPVANTALDVHSKLAPATALLPQFVQLGGTTNGFPALKQSGNSVLFRLADDAGPATIQGNLSLGSNGTIAMSSTALIANTAPTLTSCGTGSVSASNGTAAFDINMGATPISTCVITLPTATTGWNCFATDITTNSTSVFLTKQTTSATGSATIGNFSDIAAATAWAANDHVRVSCFAY